MCVEYLCIILHLPSMDHLLCHEIVAMTYEGACTKERIIMEWNTIARLNHIGMLYACMQSLSCDSILKMLTFCLPAKTIAFSNWIPVHTKCEIDRSVMDVRVCIAVVVITISWNRILISIFYFFSVPSSHTCAMDVYCVCAFNLSTNKWNGEKYKQTNRKSLTFGQKLNVNVIDKHCITILQFAKADT